MAFSLAFLAGVLTLLALPSLPGAWLPTFLLVVLGCGAVLSRTLSRIANRTVATRYLTVVYGCIAGFALAWVHAALYLADSWPARRGDDRVIAQVIVDTIPVMRGGVWLFDGVTTIESPERDPGSRRVRLTWREAPAPLHVGERWRLLLALQPPRAHVNPGAPDGERALFHDRVHALGNVVNASINERIDAGHRPLDRLRERIAQRIDERVTDRDAAALIEALAVGVTGTVSREQWRVFNVTGTTHLVAISGLHVTLFAVVTIALMRTLWSVALHRVVSWPRENFAALLGFLAAAVYATLSGLSVPTQRTLIMLGMWLLTRSVARASTPFHAFALALLAVLVVDPFAVLAPGFWLSFGAMAAIILVSSTRFLRRPRLAEALRVQAAVTILLVPLTLACFGSLSLIGPLVNLVAIPAMSWIFVPTILCAVAFEPLWHAMSDGALTLAAWMHERAWPWLATAADVPWALLHASPPIWWYAIAGVAVLVSLMPLPLALRAAALIAVTPLAVGGSTAPAPGAVDITVLDVGEGTSVIVQTAAHVLVWGTGDIYGSEGRMAESVLIPVLRSRGLLQVDLLVLSELALGSPGTTALMAELPVRAALIGTGSVPDLPAARACEDAPAWRWEGVLFDVIRAATESNERGCVLEITTGELRAVLPIAVTPGVEASFLRRGRPSTEVVVVPRNGSDAASPPELIRALNAHWAVVSGRRTRAGREKTALARWQAQGAAVLATADRGAIRLRLDPRKGPVEPRGAREGNRTLWRGLP